MRQSSSLLREKRISKTRENYSNLFLSLEQVVPTRLNYQLKLQAKEEPHQSVEVEWTHLCLKKGLAHKTFNLRSATYQEELGLTILLRVLKLILVQADKLENE